MLPREGGSSIQKSDWATSGWRVPLPNKGTVRIATRRWAALFPTLLCGAGVAGQHGITSEYQAGEGRLSNHAHIYKSQKLPSKTHIP